MEFSGGAKGVVKESRIEVITEFVKLLRGISLIFSRTSAKLTGDGVKLGVFDGLIVKLGVIVMEGEIVEDAL